MGAERPEEDEGEREVRSQAGTAVGAATAATEIARGPGQSCGLFGQTTDMRLWSNLEAAELAGGRVVSTVVPLIVHCVPRLRWGKMRNAGRKWWGRVSHTVQDEMHYPRSPLAILMNFTNF